MSLRSCGASMRRQPSRLLTVAATLFDTAMHRRSIIFAFLLGGCVGQDRPKPRDSTAASLRATTDRVPEAEAVLQAYLESAVITHLDSTHVVPDSLTACGADGSPETGYFLAAARILSSRVVSDTARVTAEFTTVGRDSTPMDRPDGRVIVLEVRTDTATWPLVRRSVTRRWGVCGSDMDGDFVRMIGRGLTWVPAGTGWAAVAQLSDSVRRARSLQSSGATSGEPTPSSVAPIPRNMTPQADAKVAPGYERIASHGMTLDLPAGALVDSGPGLEPRESVALRVRKLWTCRFSCTMSLTVRPLPPDTTFDLWIHKLTNPGSLAPDANGRDPSILDSAAVNGAPAYLLETYCGDCTARALYALRDRQIVILRWSVDDRESVLAEAQLLAVAHTLRRRPAASP